MERAPRPPMLSNPTHGPTHAKDEDESLRRQTSLLPGEVRTPSTMITLADWAAPGSSIWLEEDTNNNKSASQPHGGGSAGVDGVRSVTHHSPLTNYRQGSDVWTTTSPLLAELGPDDGVTSLHPNALHHPTPHTLPDGVVDDAVAATAAAALHGLTPHDLPTPPLHAQPDMTTMQMPVGFTVHDGAPQPGSYAVHYSAHTATSGMYPALALAPSASYAVTPPETTSTAASYGVAVSSPQGYGAYYAAPPHGYDAMESASPYATAAAASSAVSKESWQGGPSGMTRSHPFQPHLPASSWSYANAIPTGVEMSAGAGYAVERDGLTETALGSQSPNDHVGYAGAGTELQPGRVPRRRRTSGERMQELLYYIANTFPPPPPPRVPSGTRRARAELWYYHATIWDLTHRLPPPPRTPLPEMAIEQQLQLRELTRAPYHGDGWLKMSERWFSVVQGLFDYPEGNRGVPVDADFVLQHAVTAA